MGRILAFFSATIQDTKEKGGQVSEFYKQKIINREFNSTAYRSIRSNVCLLRCELCLLPYIASAREARPK